MTARLGERQQVQLWRAIHKAIRDLVAQDPAVERFLGGAPALQSVAADAHFADQSGSLQGTHATHDGVVADQRVRPVHLEEVQAGDPKPLRAGYSAVLYRQG